MSSLTPSRATPTARQIRRQLLVQRIDAGVEAVPTGPAVPAIVVRNSSFGGFPAGPLALISGETPASTLARYSAG